MIWGACFVAGHIKSGSESESWLRTGRKAYPKWLDLVDMESS